MLLRFFTFASYVLLLWLGGCKTLTQNAADLQTTESAKTPKSTFATLEYLTAMVKSGQPWPWAIDVAAYNQEIHGERLTNGKELFGRPFRELTMCTDQEKLSFQGKPAAACMGWDNLMTYLYNPQGDAERVPSGYVHIIPQRNGSAQPELEEFLQEGDVIVYFHPEQRGGILGAEHMQWRSTHATMLVRKNGKLFTAETPEDYSNFFDGADPTPFHVFRFMPKNKDGLDLPESEAQKYRAMAAKWASLGFSQFVFTPNYDAAAGRLKGPQSIAAMADWYIKAATTAEGIPKCSELIGDDCFPQLYCSWFVFNNLNLGWMHPFNRQGLAGVASAGLITPDKTFTNIKAGLGYDSSMAMNSYWDESVAAHANTYVFKPLTAFGLIHAFVTRLVGDDTVPAATAIDLKNFAVKLQTKSTLIGVTEGFANSTFASRLGMVPAFDAKKSGEFNKLQSTLIKQMALLYRQAAQTITKKLDAKDLIGAREDAVQATDAIRHLYQEQLAKTETEFFDVSKRWIPPYMFAYVAEGLHSDFNKSESPGAAFIYGKKPVMAYIATVINERFLVKNGTAAPPPASTILIKAPVATAEDAALDASMYERLGISPTVQDGKGYQLFFECLSQLSKSACGAAKATRFMTPAERDLLIVLVKSWRTERPLAATSVKERHAFGLDPISFRRLLASYWNDPEKIFRPNVFEGSNWGVSQIVINLRLLLKAPLTLAARQAESHRYAQKQRLSPVFCQQDRTDLPVRQSGQPSCAYTITPADSVNIVEADIAESSYGDWQTSLQVTD